MNNTNRTMKTEYHSLTLLLVVLDNFYKCLNKMTYFTRVLLEEVLEEDIFFNYEQYSNLLEDSEW